MLKTMREIGIQRSLFAVAILFGVAVIIFPAKSANAAGSSFYLSPATGNYIVGSTFTVTIYLNTSGQSVNAIEADLQFPAQKLQVVSPSSGVSLIQIWTDQPSYSNSNGTLTFQGAIPNPGILMALLLLDLRQSLLVKRLL